MFGPERSLITTEAVAFPSDSFVGQLIDQVTKKRVGYLAAFKKLWRTSLDNPEILPEEQRPIALGALIDVCPQSFVAFLEEQVGPKGETHSQLIVKKEQEASRKRQLARRPPKSQRIHTRRIKARDDDWLKEIEV